MIKYTIVSEVKKEFFHRVGYPLPSIPLTVGRDTPRALRLAYAEKTRELFPDNGIALGVIRHNLNNRLAHARKNNAKGDVQIDVLENNDYQLIDDSDPEKKTVLFLSTPSLKAAEVHAELLHETPVKATDTRLAQTALTAISFDFGGDIVSSQPAAHIKAMREVRLDDTDYVVVRSKVEGLNLELGGKQVSLHVRRAGAVALNEIEDPRIRQAFKVITHVPPDTDSVDRTLIDAHRQIAHAYLDTAPASYTSYVQSYYLTRDVPA